MSHEKGLFTELENNYFLVSLSRRGASGHLKKKIIIIQPIPMKGKKAQNIHMYMPCVPACTSDNSRPRRLLSARLVK